MEPFIKKPDSTKSPEQEFTDASNQTLQNDQLKSEQIPTNSQNESIEKQMLEKLKDERDKLRGTLDLNEAQSKQKNLKPFLYALASLTILSLVYLLMVKPATKPEEIQSAPTQSSFVLPSDFASKTSEEKNALQIIEAARKNDSEKIITSWLDRGRVAQTEDQLKKLISSYSTSADGSSVKLIEKKVGKKSPTQETALADGMEYEAASLIYQSKYFNRSNKIYTKINLYKPDSTQDVWKMYLFEFKEGGDSSPLKAEIEITTN
jgi:hypothetical protein